MKPFKPLFVTLLALVSLFGMSLSVHAQGAAPAFAAVKDGNIVIMSANAPVTITNPPNKGILSLEWNPGATKLAYILYDDQYEPRIAVADASGQSAPVLLDTGKLEAGFPVSWTPDGQIMFVGSGELPTDASQPYKVDIKRMAPEAGAVPEVIGTFIHGVGCGGGSPYPADGEYWEDAGFGGNAVVLRYTDYGILHSSTCAGGGLALFAPQGGQDTPLAVDTMMTPQVGAPQQQVARPVLGNDGKTLASIKNIYAEPQPIYTLVLIDLSTQQTTEVKTAEPPDQLAWSPDGTLFYSARKQTSNLAANLTAEQKQKVEAVFGSSDFEIPSYEVSIHQLNVTTGEDKVVHTASAYVVGRMAVTADGKAVVFSQIANMDKWVEGIANGTLDVLNDMDGKAQRAAVPVTLYWLPLDGTAATPLGDMLSQFRLKP